jgi:hypothetical protein
MVEERGEDRGAGEMKPRSARDDVEVTEGRAGGRRWEFERPRRQSMTGRGCRERRISRGESEVRDVAGTATREGGSHSGDRDNGGNAEDDGCLVGRTFTQ